MKACPHCGWSPSDTPSAPTEESARELARTDSVAEAGYLVSLLEEAGIAARATPIEAFDAARGAWSSGYRVSVPKTHHDAASRVLTAESHSGFSQVAERVFDRDDHSSETPRVNPWRMLTVLAFIAAAGALAMNTLGHPLRRARRIPQQKPHDARAEIEPLAALANALNGEAPLRSEVGSGPGLRLSHSPASDTLILATDADGDGRYESQRRFAARPIDPRPGDD